MLELFSSQTPDKDLRDDISLRKTLSGESKPLTDAQRLRREDEKEEKQKKLFSMSTEEALENSAIIGSIMGKLLELQTTVTVNGKHVEDNQVDGGGIADLVTTAVASIIGTKMRPIKALKKLLNGKFGTISKSLISVGTKLAGLAGLTAIYSGLSSTLNSGFSRLSTLMSGMTGALSRIPLLSKAFEKAANTKALSKVKTPSVSKKELGVLDKLKSMISGKASAVKNFVTDKADSLGKYASKNPWKVGKGALKKVPVLGLLAGLGFGAKRALGGDFKGAGMEVLSGGMSMIPWAGTAGSIATDIKLSQHDKDLETQKMFQKPVTRMQTSTSPNKTDIDSNPEDLSSYAKGSEDVEYLKREIAKVESTGDYDAQNPTSTAYGKYQFLEKVYKEAARALGKSVAELKTPSGQEEAMNWLLKQNMNGLKRQGIPVNPFTVYGAHQQGLTGIGRILKGKSTSTDLRNMYNNTPSRHRHGDIRGDWLRYWKGKFNGSTPSVHIAKTNLNNNPPQVSIDMKTSTSSNMMASKKSTEHSEGGQVSNSSNQVTNHITVSPREFDPTDIDV